MKRTSVLLGFAFLCAQFPLGTAQATQRTYDYAISHPLYGNIGTYDRIVDETAADSRAESHLAITVRIFGFVVHTETADQIETWHGAKLTSFHSVTTVNGRQTIVHGEDHEDRFVITSPEGTVTAPAGVVASDPLSLNRMGHGNVVSLKSGRIFSVEVAGGEADTVTVQGNPVAARHYHADTPTLPNKWEVWFDRHGVPIKFSSLESNGPVAFTLVAWPQVVGGSDRRFGEVHQ